MIILHLPKLQNTMKIDQKIWKPHRRTQVVEYMSHAVGVTGQKRQLTAPMPKYRAHDGLVVCTWRSTESKD